MDHKKAKANRDSRQFHRWVVGGARLLAVAGGCLIALWVLFALFHFPGWSAWIGYLAASVWLGLWIWVLRSPRRNLRFILLSGGLVAAWVLGFTVVPSNDREWMPDQVKLPFARVHGPAVTIENVRFASYRSENEYDLRWETRTYDLDGIQTVDFIIEPFSSWQGLAHTFLTFGFSDGEYVAISVEIRKEQGESFSPVRGLFKHYEIAYVVGDERDLIGLRANIRRDPVMLFPIRASPEQVRALFVSMLERANQLRSEPEFYHSLFNTCTTNIVRHTNELRRQQIGLGWRTIFPGFADNLALDLDLLDFRGPLEEARRRFLINDRAAFDDASDGREWSRRIRALPAERSEREPAEGPRGGV